MSRWRRSVAALAVVSIVGVVLVLGFRADAPGVEAPVEPTSVAAPLPRPEPPRLGQRDAPARRVAGRVTFEGQPVAGASVRLEADGILFLAPRSLVADGGGRFDFGEQPARTFTVSASQQGRTGAREWIDVRDPRTHPESLELVLTGCEDRLTGKVFDPEGGVIAHARIRSPNTLGSETDAQGHYELCLPRGSGNVVVDAAGYAGLRMRVIVLGRTPLEVVLTPEATVVGRVVLRGTHQPVPGARVAVFPAESGRAQPTTAWAETDASGRFRVGVAPGEHRASATAEGLSSLELVPVSATMGLESEELTLELVPLSRVRGRVMSAGQAVAGARVALRGAIGYAEAISQADGRFVVDLVVPGEVTFSAQPWEVISPLHLQVEQPEESVELEVKKLGSVKGVVTREGKPVAHASVHLDSRTHQSLSADADQQGRYELAGAGAGTWRLGAQSEQAGAFTEDQVLELAAGEDKVVNLELDLAATIAGTVRSEDGSAVAGVFVDFKMKRNGDRGQSLTDADGHFLCTAMSGGGEYVPQVFPSAMTRAPFKPARGASFPAVALPGRASHVEGVELIIQYQRLEIRGRVVDGQDEPVADARVSAVSVESGEPPVFLSWASLATAVSDTQGAFSFQALPGGAWGLQAIAPDGSQAIVNSVAAGAKDVVIKVQRPGGIDGTLVGYQGERPAVYAQPTTPNTRSIQGQVKGDRFSVQAPPGAYLVSAISATEGDAQRVEVKEGVRTPVTLTNRGRATVTGVVTEHRTHAPVPGLRCHAIVVAADQPGMSNASLESAPVTDEQGAFRIDPSPAGEIMVRCFSHTGDTSSGAAMATVAAGGRAAFSLEVVHRALTGVMGDLGVTLHPVVPYVVAVRRGSAADGLLLVGDRVVELDGESCERLSADGVQVVIENHPPGSRLAIAVRRGSETRIFTIKVGASP